MYNKNKTQESTNKQIIDLISTEQFSQLDSKMQNKIINCFYTESNKTEGIFGKILGNNPSHIAMYIALILCLSLLFLTLNPNLTIEKLDVIIPVITLYIGYLFGNNSKFK